MAGAVSVLLVETDELEFRERREQLLMDGYAVEAVGAVDQARVRLADGPDALVLSSGPETIGLLRELRAGEIPRADCRLPVLVVGVDDDSAAVRYHRAGADVALPSESSGLLVAAGLEALTRRAGPQDTRTVRVGRLTLDRDARTAQVDGLAVSLTRLEFDLLATLASEPRRTFTRAELTREVWEVDPQAAGPSPRSIATPTGSDKSSTRPARSRWSRPSAASAGDSPNDPHLPTRSLLVLADAPATVLTVRGVSHCDPDMLRTDGQMSQERDSSPRFPSHAPERPPRHAKILSMHDRSCCVVTGGSSDSASYPSAYLSSYTSVYINAEVS